MRSLVLSAIGTLCLALPSQSQEVAPSPYGAWDRAGASNLMTEGKAIEAANLIRRGRVIPIGRDYSPDMTMEPGQDLSISGTDKPAHTNGGAVFMEEVVSGNLTQIGTHLNGLGSIGQAGEPTRFYNGLLGTDIIGGNGIKELGIEQVKPFFTRGMMIDLVTIRGRALEAGEEITVADIETALEWHEMAPPKFGDVVIFHTGWGRHWKADADTFLSGSPGIGAEAADWLVNQGVALIGTDSWSPEVKPVDDVSGGFPVQSRLTPENGIFFHVNLETERLIDAEITEFAFIFAPLKIVGATGSPGEPLAVY